MTENSGTPACIFASFRFTSCHKNVNIHLTTYYQANKALPSNTEAKVIVHKERSCFPTQCKYWLTSRTHCGACYPETEIATILPQWSTLLSYKAYVSVRGLTNFCGRIPACPFRRSWPRVSRDHFWVHEQALVHGAASTSACKKPEAAHGDEAKKAQTLPKQSDQKTIQNNFNPGSVFPFQDRRKYDDLAHIVRSVAQL